jgi:hypothetical protein
VKSEFSSSAFQLPRQNGRMEEYDVERARMRIEGLSSKVARSAAADGGNRY